MSNPMTHWNGGETSGGTGQPIPPSEEAQQMPLGMMNGPVDGSEAFDSASIDSGKKGKLNGVLLMVIIVAVGGGTLWAMRKSSILAPKDAAAVAVEKKIDEAITRLGKPSANPSALSAGSVESMMQDADSVLALFANDPAKAQVELSDLAKNPFELQITKAADQKDPNAGAETIDRARQERRKAMETEIKGMKLQTLLSGSKPMAVISGKVVRPGDTVGSFAVVAIEQAGVKITADGEEFMLLMVKPNAGKE